MTDSKEKDGDSMKIAMIGHKRVPSREGGIEIVVEELSVRLVSMGHQVDCYNRWHGSGNAGKMPREYKGIRLIRIPTFRRTALNAFVYSVLAAVRAILGGYDVIHFHAEGPGAMAFMPRLLGIPVVVTIHGLDWQRAKWGGFATRYLRWSERNAARFSDALLVLSRGNKRYFRETYNRNAIYIPNGVNVKPPLEPEEIGRVWGLEKNGYILFLARLVPEKGLHYLIEAYKKVTTDKRLVIAGELTEKDAYVRKIRGMTEGDDRILLAGFVQGRVLEELLANCSIYVLPSDVEGMSISLLEALSYGVRCLVSDIEENMDTAAGYAVCFPRGNVPMLQKSLEELLNQRECVHDSAGQIEFVRRHYSWDSAVKKLLDVYADVSKKGSQGDAAQ